MLVPPSLKKAQIKNAQSIKLIKKEIKYKYFILDIYC